MIFSPNLPLALPEELTAAITIVERSETWVNAHRTRDFLNGQRKLHALLLKRRTFLKEDIFLPHFAIVLAFSTFKENFALLKALAVRHEEYLTALLAPVIRDHPFVAPNPPGCWGALRWRMKYATTMNILMRVFSEERLELIKSALKEDD